jgi:hypothetical protein
MASDKLLKGFLDLMKEKNWILGLKAGAEKIHQLPGPTIVKQEVKREREVRSGKGILNGRPFLREAIEVSLADCMRITADETGRVVL